MKDWGEPTILRSDMPPSMSDELYEHARSALSAHSLEKDAAMAIKRGMEASNGGIWHVVVGQAFGCSITNQTGHVCFFKLQRPGQKPFFVVCFQSLDEEANAMSTMAGDAEEGKVAAADLADAGSLEGKDVEEEKE